MKTKAHTLTSHSPTLLTSGSISAISAYALFALSAPLTKFLMERGQSIGIAGDDAISFCNLLFWGNMAAATLVFLLSGQRSVVEGFTKLSRRGLVSLLVTSSLSIITPAAFFFSLHGTTVANVIFISRAGPIFYAVGGTLLMGKVISRNQQIGYGFIIAAIVLALVYSTGAMFSFGDLLALGAAFGAAMISLTGQVALAEMGLKPFVFARNLISAIAFAAIAFSMLGPIHFADLVQPQVLGAVAVYGVLVVGAAQLLWFNAVVHATPKVIGGWSFISPMIAIVATTLLLQERPHGAHWCALAMVVVGMTIASRGTKQEPQRPADATLAAA